MVSFDKGSPGFEGREDKEGGKVAWACIVFPENQAGKKTVVKRGQKTTAQKPQFPVVVKEKSAIEWQRGEKKTVKSNVPRRPGKKPLKWWRKAAKGMWESGEPLESPLPQKKTEQCPSTAQ